MATFWERAALSVYRIFSLYFDLLQFLVISHCGFEGRTLVLIASVPAHCLSFTFFELSYSVSHIRTNTVTGFE